MKNSSDKNAILLEKIFSSTSDAFVILDKEGIIKLVNPAAEKLFGKQKQELLGQPFGFPISGTDKEEIEIILKDRKYAVGVIRIAEIEWEGETSYLTSIKDITERKQAENIQKTLFNISNALNTVDNMQDLYSKIREFMGNVIDTTNFYVALYDKDNDLISFDYYEDEFVSEKKTFAFRKFGKGLTEYVIRTNKPLLATEKVLEKLVHSREVEMIGVSSKIWLGVPLKIENKVMGVIAVQSYDDPHLYVEKDMEILTFVSEEIALAIQHKQADEQIKKDLEEKNILLQEIHHRVKNNMQVVSSLLKLQSSYIEDEKALELFKNSQNRVRSMALIHDLLYSSKDMANIDFAEYVKSLTIQLISSFAINTNLIKLKINIKDIMLDINLATPCGFIINELVSNSLKYAFPAIADKPEGRKGELSIGFTFENETYVLSVKDNGIGISEEIDLKDSQTLGLMLVNMFIKQLNGTLELEKVKGTSFKITFKKKTIKTFGKV